MPCRPSAPRAVASHPHLPSQLPCGPRARARSRQGGAGRIASQSSDIRRSAEAGSARAPTAPATPTKEADDARAAAPRRTPATTEQRQAVRGDRAKARRCLSLSTSAFPPPNGCSRLPANRLAATLRPRRTSRARQHLASPATCESNLSTAPVEAKKRRWSHAPDGTACRLPSRPDAGGLKARRGRSPSARSSPAALRRTRCRAATARASAVRSRRKALLRCGAGFRPQACVRQRQALVAVAGAHLVAPCRAGLTRLQPQRARPKTWLTRAAAASADQSARRASSA